MKNFLWSNVMQLNAQLIIAQIAAQFIRNTIQERDDLISQTYEINGVSIFQCMY